MLHVTPSNDLISLQMMSTSHTSCQPRYQWIAKTPSESSLPSIAHSQEANPDGCPSIVDPYYSFDLSTSNIRHAHQETFPTSASSSVSSYNGFERREVERCIRSSASFGPSYALSPSPTSQSHAGVQPSQYRYAPQHLYQSSLSGALDEGRIRYAKRYPSMPSLLPSSSHSTLKALASAADACPRPENPSKSELDASPYPATRSNVRRREYKKLHECHICHKMFPRPSGLKTHMNTHDHIRPYKCLVEGCDKSFTVKSNCKRHMRTHGMSLEESSRRFEEHAARLQQSRPPSPESPAIPISEETICDQPSWIPENSHPVTHTSCLPMSAIEWEETYEYYSDELPSPRVPGDDWRLASGYYTAHAPEYDNMAPCQW